ncbi:hypothetical protein [Pseudonocardia sp. WMMC193]|uniref:hypothetical protein n=1 Tax=Pseudonocardia sp. WMMC193 TaxID=2911965 RepID=UPI001F16A14E|nr:hypothetical protein [Pseudonocardia sp. WMMC193]MCF7553771.1 hypothetical protein [Pseudonocardia sp. WMMC193]
MGPLTRGEAAEQLAAATGREPEIASAMIRDYLDDTSEQLGFSVHRWGLDAGDVEEIRRGYEWVDYERGETAAQARTRAAEYAQGWTEIAATDDSPGYSGHVDRQAALWTERARGFEAPAEVPVVEQEADAEGWSR